ncbi:hypothetical protein HNY73_004664 [Argiope bruennichi]|uniref:Uncharacterized protein n=1 Tax=Argiope bruennichi TaxID=94029 RepID=A0A8T0FWH3_ARGBR|nr:hypothetical protein HNY73_004664 [Argiope bruennichi]
MLSPLPAEQLMTLLSLPPSPYFRKRSKKWKPKVTVRRDPYPPRVQSWLYHDRRPDRQSVLLDEQSISIILRTFCTPRKIVWGINNIAQTFSFDAVYCG